MRPKNATELKTQPAKILLLVLTTSLSLTTAEVETMCMQGANVIKMKGASTSPTKQIEAAIETEGADFFIDG